MTDTIHNGVDTEKMFDPLDLLDGFRTRPRSGGGSTFVLRYAATTAEIRTGQVVIKRLSDAEGNEVATFSKTLQYVFATVPALVSYTDGAGHSGSVSYPVPAGEAPPGPPGGPGSGRNAFPVAPRPAGDSAAGEVLVTLTFWQPQRRPLDGEPGYSEPRRRGRTSAALRTRRPWRLHPIRSRACSPTRAALRTPTPSPISRSHFPRRQGDPA